MIKYGIWKDGKREKWFDNEDEFVNFLEPKDEKYIFAFQSDRNRLKKYLQINEDDESENGNSNDTIKEFQKNKNDQTDDEEEEY